MALADAIEFAGETTSPAERLGWPVRVSLLLFLLAGAVSLTLAGNLAAERNASPSPPKPRREGATSTSIPALPESPGLGDLSARKPTEVSPPSRESQSQVPALLVADTSDVSRLQARSDVGPPPGSEPGSKERRAARTHAASPAAPAPGASRPAALTPPPPAPASAAEPPPPPRQDPGPRRVRVADESGRVMIARSYGGPTSGWVLLPDGQLARTNGMAYTDEPFRPLTAEQLRTRLLGGEYKDFDCLQTGHYLIFYQCSDRFAEQSGKLLDSLYEGLIGKFRRYKLDVHEAEFPLVAVIFRTEADFRAHRAVAPDVQAYYEIVSNRIFFYETRDRELDSPEVAAMRQPQTVAHEGTHQILQNIGVQPRLAEWPTWLVEGLAELAAAPLTRKGEWVGFNWVNPVHMATLQDLAENQALGPRVGRGGSMVRYILTRKDLSPTDYALAWALTHYLARHHEEKFLGYLRALSRMDPLRGPTPEEHLAEFERHFGPVQVAADRSVREHLARQKYHPLVYFAVTFEQTMPNGAVRRGTLVSRSPLVIREWLGQVSSEGGAYVWHAHPFQSQSLAAQFAEQWLASR